MAEVIPAEHHSGNPAECEADADDVLDQLEVDDKGVNHVTRIFWADAFKFQPAVQARSKETAGDPHTKKEKSCVGGVSYEKVCVCINFLSTDGEKKRRGECRKVDRACAVNDWSSDFLEHEYLPKILKVDWSVFTSGSILLVLNEWVQLEFYNLKLFNLRIKIKINKLLQVVVHVSV